MSVALGCGGAIADTPGPKPMTSEPTESPAATSTGRVPSQPAPVSTLSPVPTPFATATAISLPTFEAGAYAGPVGTWEGRIERPSDTLLVRVILSGCDRVGDRCGSLEYFEPMQGDIALCAPLLLYRGGDAEVLVFEEVPSLRQEECLPMLVRFRAAGPESFDIERFLENDDPCCVGSVARVSDVALTDTPAPLPVQIDGFEAGATIDLGARTTPFTTETSDSAFFPLISSVAAVDFDTGGVREVVAYDEGSALHVEAHALAAIGEAVWVARTAEHRLERIDDADTGTDAIALDDPPTALAADGETLWVTSYKGSSVTRVDTRSGAVEATIPVHNPMGIAVGDGGVWVGMNSDDHLVRVDPLTNAITDTVQLGRGNGPACGMCVQNVVVGNGAVWTANNRARSVGRVDTRTLEVTEITTEYRAWAVAAGGGSIWASQMEEFQGLQDHARGGLVRIDPTTLEVSRYDIPGLLSVQWHGERLWLVVPASRSDLLYEYVPVD